MLKWFYKTKEEIPENLLDFYQEKDGVFVLQVDGGVSNESVKSIKEELQNVRKEKIKLEENLNKFGDVTFEDYTTLKDQLDELKAKTISSKDADDIAKEINERVNEIVEIKSRDYKREIDSIQEKLNSADQKAQDLTIKLHRKELETRLQNITKDQIDPRSFRDVLNKATLDKLAYNEEIDDFVDKDSKRLKEWFVDSLENSRWEKESVSGGALGGKGGKNKNRPMSPLELIQEANQSIKK